MREKASDLKTTKLIIFVCFHKSRISTVHLGMCWGLSVVLDVLQAVCLGCAGVSVWVFDVLESS